MKQSKSLWPLPFLKAKLCFCYLSLFQKSFNIKISAELVCKILSCSLQNFSAFSSSTVDITAELLSPQWSLRIYLSIVQDEATKCPFVVSLWFLFLHDDTSFTSSFLFPRKTQVPAATSYHKCQHPPVFPIISICWSLKPKSHIQINIYRRFKTSPLFSYSTT